MALDDLAGAQRHLDASIELVGDDLLALAAALRRRAKLAIRLGDTNLALISFEGALPLYARLTSAGDVAEVALEYAALLLQQGRRPELRALAADVSGWVHELQGNSRLRDTAADFKSMVDLGALDPEALEGLGLRVVKAKVGPRIRKRRGRSRT